MLKHLIYIIDAYRKNSDDITNLFNLVVPIWNIKNNQKMMLKDANFVPIPDPYFVEENDEMGNVLNAWDRFKTMPAFDYIKTVMLDLDVPLKALLQVYILEEDKGGRFDF